MMRSIIRSGKAAPERQDEWGTCSQRRSERMFVVRECERRSEWPELGLLVQLRSERRSAISAGSARNLPVA